MSIKNSLIFFIFINISIKNKNKTFYYFTCPMLPQKCPMLPQICLFTTLESVEKWGVVVVLKSP